MSGPDSLRNWLSDDCPFLAPGADVHVPDGRGVVHEPLRNIRGVQNGKVRVHVDRPDGTRTFATFDSLEERPLPQPMLATSPATQVLLHTRLVHLGAAAIPEPIHEPMGPAAQSSGNGTSRRRPPAPPAHRRMTVPDTAVTTQAPAAPTPKTSAPDYRMTEAEYLEKFWQRQLTAWARNIESARAQLLQLGPRATQRRARRERDIAIWRRCLDDNRESLAPHLAARARATYVETIKGAIRKSKDVPENVVAQYPEFRRAVDAHARYLKGRRTSFGNRTVAVVDTMQAVRGYKVKRQDGTMITESQIEEIARGVDEIEAVLGPLADILRANDVTIAHTNGKHPFMSDAGGSYVAGERTASIGVRTRLGTCIASLGHELAGHMLDFEAGYRLGADTHVRPGKRSTSLADDDRGRRREVAEVIDRARRLIRDQLEICYWLKQRLKDHEALPQAVEMIETTRLVLTHYWTQPREIWARLVEQYLATRLSAMGRTPTVAVFPAYTHALGYWKAEDWPRLEADVEQELRRRIAILRAHPARPASPPPRP